MRLHAKSSGQKDMCIFRAARQMSRLVFEMSSRSCVVFFSNITMCSGLSDPVSRSNALCYNNNVYKLCGSTFIGKKLRFVSCLRRKKSQNIFVKMVVNINLMLAIC